jgi:hypothetical protein
MTNNNTYFGKIEEQAVIDFINSESIEERNNIYNNVLKKPFNKMICSILRKYPIHIGNFSVYELETDALVHLIDKVSKFNPDAITKKGNKTKAYSYCQTIVRNYFRDHSVKSYNENIRNLNYDDYTDKCDEKYYEIDSEEYLNNITDIEVLISSIIKKIELKLSKDQCLLNENEIIVGTTLIHILNNWQTLFIEDDYSRDCNNGGCQKNKILQYLKTNTGLSMKKLRNCIKKTFNSIYLIEKSRLLFIMTIINIISF